MKIIVIGNAIALVAAILQTIAGMINNKKKIIIVQSAQAGCFSLSNFILGGYSGTIINILSLIRNILCYKEKLNLTAKIILTVLSSALCIYFNNLGFIGLFPLFVMLAYIWFMNIKDLTKFKLLITFTLILWLTFDLYIKSYTSSIFDFASIVANVVTMIQINIKPKENKEEKI